MISCANLSPTLCFLLVVLTVTLLFGHRWPAVCAVAGSASKAAAPVSQTPVTHLTEAAAAAVENDTVVVGSQVHPTKVAPPGDDLLPAGSKKFVDDFFNNDKFAKQGFKKSHSSKGADGYNKHDTFHTKDGDRFGYAQHFEFDKKGGDKHGGGYHERSMFDDDNAAGSMPKFSEWHFEKMSNNPSKSYSHEDGDDLSLGQLIGGDFEELEGSASRRSKRKKEHPSASEYDNYEYADVEEPDDGASADFEADDVDPEYAALYADADAYDYY